MSSPRKPTKFQVIWEPVPNPDPHALLQAVAMLFDRRVPLSTDVDLIEIGDTLSSPQEPHY
jgi:hypothetical protein